MVTASKWYRRGVILDLTKPSHERGQRWEYVAIPCAGYQCHVPQTRPFVVDVIDPCPMRQQHIDGPPVAVPDRRHERGIALNVLGLRIRAMRSEEHTSELQS